MIKLALLGEMQVLRRDRPVPLPASRKTRALLAYLAVTAKPQRRDHLCRMFWNLPDDPRGALRWSLSKLRGILNEDEELLVADRQTVSLNLNPGDVDLLDIQARLAGGLEGLSDAALTRLAERASGRFLADLDLSHEPEFELWCIAMREDVRKIRAQILTALIERRADDPERALPFARRLGDMDPLDEEKCATLIRLLVAAGRREEARRQYEACSARLHEAGIPPSPRLQTALTPGAPSQKTPHRAPPVSSPVLPPQSIRYCSARDGTNIAYACAGAGPPLINIAAWYNHLEYDWESPLWRPLYVALTDRHQLIRYDQRGNGLSDWKARNISLEAFLDDLEAVVEATMNAAGIRRFPIFAISQACAVAIAYAARHPEKITRIVMINGYMTGWKRRCTAREREYRSAITALIKTGWEQLPVPLMQYFNSLFIPDGSPEHHKCFDDLRRLAVSAENATRLYEAWGDLDVYPLARDITAPTLVFHSRDDRVVPFICGQQIAKTIPGARFVPLESRSHLILDNDPCWPRYLREIRQFLAEDAAPLPG